MTAKEREREINQWLSSYHSPCLLSGGDPVPGFMRVKARKGDAYSSHHPLRPRALPFPSCTFSRIQGLHLTPAVTSFLFPKTGVIKVTLSTWHCQSRRVVLRVRFLPTDKPRVEKHPGKPFCEGVALGKLPSGSPV